MMIEWLQLRDPVRNYFNIENEKLISLISWQQVFRVVWICTKLSWWWQRLLEDELRILTCLSHVSNKVALQQNGIHTFVGVCKGNNNLQYYRLRIRSIRQASLKARLSFSDHQWIFSYVSLERILMWLNLWKNLFWCFLMSLWKPQQVLFSFLF